MAVVAFVYADWLLRYPEFTATTNSAQASDAFLQAGLWCANTDGSVVQDIPTRTLLLYQLTAHVAQLLYGSTKAAAGPIVGRMDGATEGSVTFTTKWPDQVGLAAFFSQTPYGTMFWMATGRYRAAVYVPPPNGGVRRRFRFV